MDCVLKEDCCCCRSPSFQFLQQSRNYKDDARVLLFANCFRAIVVGTTTPSHFRRCDKDDESNRRNCFVFRLSLESASRAQVILERRGSRKL
jgi:hypothetical protein